MSKYLWALIQCACSATVPTNPSDPPRILAVPAALAVNPVRVVDLDGLSGGTKASWWTWVEAEVRDAANQPVAGVIVCTYWWGSYGQSFPYTPVARTTCPSDQYLSSYEQCTTGTNGRCRYQMGPIKSQSCYTHMRVRVVGVIALGVVYDFTLNTEVDGDSDGTEIIVPRAPKTVANC